MIKKVNLTEVSEAMKEPSIVHEVFCRPKHWIKGTKTQFGKSLWCNLCKKDKLLSKNIT